MSIKDEEARHAYKDLSRFVGRHKLALSPSTSYLTVSCRSSLFYWGEHYFRPLRFRDPLSLSHQFLIRSNRKVVTLLPSLFLLVVLLVTTMAKGVFRYIE